MPKPKRDEIDDLNEWQEHQYNPGYWINRLPAGFPPKNTKGLWIIALIESVLFVPSFIFLLINYLSHDHAFNVLMATIILGCFSIFSVFRVIRLKPSPRIKIRTQAELDEIRRKENLEKKKDHPKRRKDYK